MSEHPTNAEIMRKLNQDDARFAQHDVLFDTLGRSVNSIIKTLHLMDKIDALLEQSQKGKGQYPKPGEP